MYAAQSGNSDTVHFLLYAGADVSAREEEGQTALFAAAFSTDTDTVRALLDAGSDSDVNAEDNVRLTPCTPSEGAPTILTLMLGAQRFDRIDSFYRS